MLVGVIVGRLVVGDVAGPRVQPPSAITTQVSSAGSNSCPSPQNSWMALPAAHMKNELHSSGCGMLPKKSGGHMAGGAEVVAEVSAAVASDVEPSVVESVSSVVSAVVEASVAASVAPVSVGACVVASVCSTVGEVTSVVVLASGVAASSVVVV